MKDTKHSVGTQYIDNLTTAERSINNARRLDNTEKIIDIIGEVVNPVSNVFGDGSTVDTQATRAEDIVSVEDIRLQGEINDKVSQTDFEASQTAQDTNIATNASDIDALETSQAAQDVVIAQKADLTYVNTELAKKVDQTVFDLSQTNQNTEITNLEIRVSNNESGIAGNDAELLDHDNRIVTLEINDALQDTDIDGLKANDLLQDTDIDALQADVIRIDAEQDVQDGRLDAVEAKDIQQDGRLETIEGLLASVSKDSSVISPQDSVTPVDSTPRIVKATIDKDFVDGSVATGGNEVAGEYTITANTDLILDIDYRFLAEKVVGEPVRFTVELYNFTQSRVEDSSENIINFAGNTTLEVVGIPLYSDSILAGDVLYFRVYTDGTNTVNVSEAKALIRAEQRVGTTEEIYDYNVISTSSVGGATVLADVNSLNANKVDETVFNSSQAAQDAIINSLPTQTDLDTLESDIQVQLDAKANDADIFNGVNIALGAKGYADVYTTGSNGQPWIKNTAGLYMLRWTNGGVEFGDPSSAGPFVFQADREANFRISGKNPLQVRNTGLWINSSSDQTGSLTSIYNVFASKTELDSKVDTTYVDAETTFLSGERVKDVDLSGLGGYTSIIEDTDLGTLKLYYPGQTLTEEPRINITNGSMFMNYPGVNGGGSIEFGETFFVSGTEVSGVKFNEKTMIGATDLYYKPTGQNWAPLEELLGGGSGPNGAIYTNNEFTDEAEILTGEGDKIFIGESNTSLAKVTIGSSAKTTNVTKLLAGQSRIDITSGSPAPGPDGLNRNGILITYSGGAGILQVSEEGTLVNNPTGSSSYEAANVGTVTTKVSEMKEELKAELRAELLAELKAELKQPA